MDGISYQVGVYDTVQLAEQAANRLEKLGYGVDDVSVVKAPKDKKFGEKGFGTGIATGGLLGAILGGVATAAVGIPLLIFGPLAIGAAGAVLGAIAGGLIEIGMKSEDVNERLQYGGLILVVHLKQESDREKVRSALDVPVGAPRSA